MCIVPFAWLGWPTPAYLCGYWYMVVLAVVMGNKVYVLDLAARVDSTAEFMCKNDWGDLSFPPPFGRDALPEVHIYLPVISTIASSPASPPLPPRIYKLWPLNPPKKRLTNRDSMVTTHNNGERAWGVKVLEVKHGTEAQKVPCLLRCRLHQYSVFTLYI